jgi:LCP family protein required for cell wall assembly
VTDPRPADSRSPALAALLSFGWPGLGQLYGGRRRVAAFLAAPVLLVAAVLLIAASGGVAVLASRMLVPAFAISFLLLVVALGVWRIAAILDAFRAVGTPVGRRRPAVRAVLALLIALVVGTHGLIAIDSWAFVDASNKIFVGAATVPSPAAGETPGPSATPAPSASDEGAGANYGGGSAILPPAPSSRITVLLTGIDAYRNRSEALNDTLLVVSVDPVAKTAVMLSVPRDTSELPLYFGGVFHDKINSLMTWAYLHPGLTPDSPIDTLTKELGYVLGIPINYYAAIDLAHFERMIDLVGGVDVNNPKLINDPLYIWLEGGARGFRLSAGRHHLNGRLALAYVRSRQGVGDSDYTRAARQQEVLVDLAKKMASPTLIAKLPSILDAAAGAIKTDLPSDRLPDMIQMASGFDLANVTKIVLGAPYNYHPPSSTTGGVWTSQFHMNRIAALSVKLFGSDSRYYTPPSPAPSASGP